MDFIQWVQRTRSSVAMYSVLTDLLVFTGLFLVLKYYNVATGGFWILPTLWFGALLLSGVRRYFVREAYLSVVGRKELRVALTDHLKVLEEHGHTVEAYAPDTLYFAMYDQAVPEEKRLDAAELEGQLALFDDAWEPLSEVVKTEWRSQPSSVNTGRKQI